ncbi:transglutaminase [Wenzhouxiangella sp. 15181]|nr:transglutaminase [Wenzhouxiangella sp. 15181]RFP69705.1 transglutaminase [Wenzhouxiangella sp. 15190]
MHATLVRSLLLVGTAFILFCCSVVISAQLKIDFQLLAEHMRERFSADRVEVIVRWRQLLEEIADRPESEQLIKVNEFFHRNVRYQSDTTLYDENDYWATPMETLGQGLGDCEDWAIAKYASLRHLGIPDERLRLIYVRAKIGGQRSPISQAHMVLGYFETPDAEPMILDSLVSSVMPASERTDLSPTFSFNADGLWVGQGSDRAAGTPLARLSRWRDVLDRMHQEGIRLQ